MRHRWPMVLLAACATVAHAGHSKVPLAAGMDAPDINSYNAVTHEKLRLSDLKGKVVVMTFWASWCGPCRAELPHLEALQEHVSKDKLVVIAIPWQESEDAISELRHLARDWKLTLLVDNYGSIASRYDVNSIPHLIIIDRAGKIRSVHVGYGDGMVDELVTEINAAFVDAPATAPPLPGAAPAPAPAPPTPTS